MGISRKMKKYLIIAILQLELLCLDFWKEGLEDWSTYFEAMILSL